MKNSTKIICPGYERHAHKCNPGDFYKDAARRGGGHSRLCKECHKARGRSYFKTQYYPANKQTLIEAAKRRKNEN